MLDRSSMPIVIVLSVLLILSIIFTYSLYRSREDIIKEFAETEAGLKTENTKLLDKVNDLTKEKKYFQDRLSRVQEDLDQLAKERDEFKDKHGAAKKERDDIAAKLEAVIKENKELQSKTQAIEEADYLKEFLKEKADLQVQVKELKISLDDAKIKSNEILQEKSEIELGLNELQAAKADLERQLKESQDFALRLSKQLTNEKGDNAIFSEEINRLTAERDKLAKQHQDSNDDKITLGREILKLNDKINKLEQDKIVLNRRLSEVNQSLQNKLSEIMQLRGYLEDVDEQADIAGFAKTDVVELPPIVVRSEESKVKRGAATALDVTLVGHIILINEQQNFVIVDLGENSGVKKNMIFGIYRDGDEIAKVQIIETREKISAADIKTIKENEAIRKGDIVKQL